MASDEPEVREFEVSRYPGGCLLPGLAVGGLVGLFGLAVSGGRSPAFALGVALVVSVLGALANDLRHPRRYRLTADGLELRGWLSQATCTWDELRTMVVGPNGVLVRRHAAGLLAVSDRRGRWRELVEAVRWRLRTSEAPAEPASVPAEQIEAWLEVEPGGFVETGRPGWVLLGAVLLVGHIVLIWIRERWGSLPWAPWLPVVTLYVGLGASCYAQWLGTQRVRASAEGLAILQRGRWQRVPWHEVVEFRAADADLEPSARPSWLLTWSVQTVQGPVSLGTRCPRARRIARTIRQVLDAMDRGEVPPQPLEVSDAAISLHRLSEPAVERGISVVRGETDDGK